MNLVKLAVALFIRFLFRKYRDLVKEPVTHPKLYGSFGLELLLSLLLHLPGRHVK